MTIIELIKEITGLIKYQPNHPFIEEFCQAILCHPLFQTFLADYIDRLNKVLDSLSQELKNKIETGFATLSSQLATTTTSTTTDEGVGKGKTTDKQPDQKQTTKRKIIRREVK